MTPARDAADPRAEYVRRTDRWGRDLARRERAHMLVSSSRLALAVAVAVLAWQAFVSHRLSSVWAVVPAAAFLGLVVVHAGVLRRIERARRARQLYARGISRLDSTWSGRGPDGARFLDGHPFAHDLDLFGPGSLFQLLDTARTEIGEETLAAWLGDGAEIQEVRARQQAIAELTPKVDFRGRPLAMLAPARRTSAGPGLSLPHGPLAPSAGLSRVHRVVFGACAVGAASRCVAWCTGCVRWTAVLAWGLVQSGIMGIWRGRIKTALTGIDTAAHVLGLIIKEPNSRGSRSSRFSRPGSRRSAPRLPSKACPLRDGSPGSSAS